MNKYLNPFEYLSAGKALGWGLAGTVVSVGAVFALVKPAAGDTAQILWLLSTNLLLWLPLSALLYLFALAMSPSRIRAIDIFATNLFALLPTCVVCCLSNAVTVMLTRSGADPMSVAGVLSQALYNFMVIMLSVSMVWSMVWGCFAYSVSANMKGVRGVVVFVSCYVFVSVVLQVITQYV